MMAKEHEVLSSGGRSVIEDEFMRLTAEAAARLGRGETLPALASLVAIQPLVGSLMAQLSEKIDLDGRLAETGSDQCSGVYL